MKSKVKKQFIFIATITLVSTFLLAFSYKTTKSSSDEWVVPAKYKSMKNPAKADVATAKALWDKHCKSCHGKMGKGDGPKAEELDTEMMDFSTEEVQGQSDGELFYKTLEGREDMPSFKKKIPAENDIWNLIHYIRTMK